jgi:glycosyltransferase involved in cell wall biosynthesis
MSKKNAQLDHARPFVSVVTPTYNRKQFMEGLVACYAHQDYPKDRMEWIMYDDGTEPASEEFLRLTAAAKLPNIRYIYDPVKVNIGAKRNRLNKESKGDIVIAMDDDDYYPPERVSHVVNRFRAFPKIELAGSSEIYMYYKDNGQIIRLGPYGPNHATNGTMAWRRSYGKTHTYDETVVCAEEKSFLEGYKHPMIQLDPIKTMLVMSHSQNTFNKNMFRQQENNHIIRKVGMTIKAFIKDRRIREIFQRDDGKPIGGVVTSGAEVLSQVQGLKVVDSNSNMITLEQLLGQGAPGPVPAPVQAQDAKPITLAV